MTEQEARALRLGDRVRRTDNHARRGLVEILRPGLVWIRWDDGPINGYNTQALALIDRDPQGGRK